MRLVIILIMVALVVALIRALYQRDETEEPGRLENKQHDDENVIEQPTVDQSRDDDR